MRRTSPKNYASAAIREVGKVASEFGEFKVNSLYIGSGTSTVIEDDPCNIIYVISNNFDMKNSEIYIETSPYDISEEKTEIQRNAEFQW